MGDERICDEKNNVVTGRQPALYISIMPVPLCLVLVLKLKEYSLESREEEWREDFYIFFPFLTKQ